MSCFESCIVVNVVLHVLDPQSVMGCSCIGKHEMGVYRRLNIYVGECLFQFCRLLKEDLLKIWVMDFASICQDL